MKVPEDIDLYSAQQVAARVAARAEIRDVRLLRSSAELERFPATGSRLKWSLDTDVSVEREEEDGAFVLRIKYVLSVVEARVESSDAEDVMDDESESGESEDRVISLLFEFAALFTLEMREGDQPINDNELQAYAITTGQFALYPYAREYIYDVTGRLGLPPLTVGVLQLPVRRDENNLSH